MKNKDDMKPGEGLLNYIERVGTETLRPPTWKEIKEIFNKPPPPFEITFHNKEVYGEFCKLIREQFNIEE